MPRDYATLPITYWQEILDAHLTASEILVIMYLLTSPNSTSVGIFMEHPQTIAEYTSLDVDEVEKAVEGLELHNLLFRFRGSWIFVTDRWRLEPSTNSPTNLTGANKVLNKCPRETQAAFHLQYPEFKEDYFQKVAGRNEIPHRSTDTETETEPKNTYRKNTKASKNKNVLTDRKVLDSEAVAHGCIGLQDTPDFLDD